jgi:hypothetical protein
MTVAVFFCNIKVRCLTEINLSKLDFVQIFENDTVLLNALIR